METFNENSIFHNQFNPIWKFPEADTTKSENQFRRHLPYIFQIIFQIIQSIHENSLEKIERFELPMLGGRRT